MLKLRFVVLALVLLVALVGMGLLAPLYSASANDR